MTAAKPIRSMHPILSETKMTVVEGNRLTGFIKLYRSLENKGWYKKSEYVHLWVHLFIKATRKEKEDWFNGKSILLKPGQFITGRKKLSVETGIQESKIERILKCFESEQQIEQVGGATSRLISICNWHLYQKVEQDDEQQMNNGRTTDEQQLNTIQELKELRESSRRKKFTPPTLDEVKAYFKEKGYQESVAIRAYNGYAEADWHDTKGNKVKNWKQKMNNVWFKDENKIKEVDERPAVDMDEYLDRPKIELPF